MWVDGWKKRGLDCCDVPRGFGVVAALCGDALVTLGFGLGVTQPLSMMVTVLIRCGWRPV